MKQQPQRYANLLREIAAIKARRIMEIGTYKGYHAKQMVLAAAAHGDVEYYGFDLFSPPPDNEHTPRTLPPPMSEVAAYLAPLPATVHLFEGDTRKTLPKLVKTLPMMDLIFIDGGHSNATIASDWRNAQKLMGERTVVIFDDYWNYKEGGSNATVDKLAKDPAFVVTLLEPVDVFPRPYGTLETRFARVVRA